MSRDRTQAKSATDFFESKLYTLRQLAERIGELALSNKDGDLLRQLTADQIEELRYEASQCQEDLQSIEHEFHEACEAALGSDDCEEDEDDEDDESVTPIPSHESLRASHDSWRLLDAYKPTQIPASKNHEASKDACVLIQAAPMQCWFNARRLIEVVDEYADAFLVEGFLVHQNLGAIEHGWVVHNGLIVDPTLPEASGPYFAGLEFQGRQSIKEFDEASREARRRKCDEPFFHAFGWGGLESPTMRDALEQATAYVEQRRAVR